MMLPFENVSVIGLGYVGLPTAAVLASRGMQVTGVDISESAVNTINQGRIHIVEPELDMLVRAASWGKATTYPAVQISGARSVCRNICATPCFPEIGDRCRVALLSQYVRSQCACHHHQQRSTHAAQRNP